MGTEVNILYCICSVRWDLLQAVDLPLRRYRRLWVQLWSAVSSARGLLEVVTEYCVAAADVTENSLDSLQGLLREGEEN